MERKAEIDCTLFCPTFKAVFNDKERVNALYSPMRPRTQNPEFYDEKINFWIKVIGEYTDERLTFSILELKAAFTINNLSPQCIPDVIENLYMKKLLNLEKDVIESLVALNNHPSRWIFWSTTSFRWYLEKLMSFKPSFIRLGYFQKCFDGDARFVFLNKLETRTKDIISSMSGIRNKLVTLHEWQKLANATGLSDHDVELVLQFLIRSRKMAIDIVGSTQVVKIEMLSSSQDAVKITDVDRKEFEVRKTMETLEIELENVLANQKDAECRAREELRSGKRLTALHHLRRRKHYEKRGNMLMRLVDNLTALLYQIEQARSDAMVIGAYEAGKAAIDKVMLDNNLTVDRATEAVLDLQQVLDDQMEINNTLSQPLVDDEEIADLDAELDYLLSQHEASVKVATEPAADSISESLAALTLEGLDTLNISGSDELRLSGKEREKLSTS